MSPKTVAAYSEVTRKLLNQSSMDVEAMIRYDLAVQLALTIDKAGFYGIGSDHQPLGLANQTGINAQAFATPGAPTYAELVNMETQIALQNADVDSMVYIGNAGLRGKLKTTLKFPTSASDATIWEPGNTVNGYKTDITNQIASGDVFFGNFADLLIGMWGGLEMMVDPYSGSKKGRVRIVCFQDVDVAVRRTASFVLGR
jgi:HK97 family phage major capsid protein